MYCGHVISKIVIREVFARFYEKELQKPNQTEFKFQKVIKKQVENYMCGGKAMIIIFTVGLIKRIYYN